MYKKGTRFTKNFIEKMVVREPVRKDPSKRLHPEAKKIWNKMTEAPLPLKFKLQEIPSPDTTFLKPLGNTETLPFQIIRTHVGNLPVYSEFRNGRDRKLTVIRKIYGDINEFKDELSKVVSNSEIYEKQGRVEVKGMHTDSVKLWLRRLGF